MGEKQIFNDAKDEMHTISASTYDGCVSIEFCDDCIFLTKEDALKFANVLIEIANGV